MRWAKALLLFASLALPGAALAQTPGTGRVTGLVSDSSSAQPVAGATVTVLGAAGIGAVTGADGRYTIANVPTGSRQIRAQRIGLAARVQTATVAAGAATTVNFALPVTAVQLSGVVTVGYGTQSRRTVSGSVASIRNEDITQVVTANPADAIKGRLPGVDVKASSFEPGAATQIRIRGARSIQASNDPLYVVDGVPINGDLRDFDSNNIESIEVLKDAAAAAVYGSRGANGVLLVTTKRGRAGRTQFSLASTFGGSEILKKPDLMDGEQFANYRREAYRAGNTAACQNYLADPTACDQAALDAKMRANLAAGVSTDWQDEVLRTGVLQNHQLSASGGSDATRFRASVGYLGQTGITITQAYNQKSGTLSLTHDYKRLNVQLSANANQSVRDAGRGSGVWDETLFNSPLGRVRDSTGALILLPTDDGIRVNPVLDAKNNIRDITRTNILGTLTGSLELIPGLRANVNFGPQYSQIDDGYFVGVDTRQYRGGATAQPDAGIRNTRNNSYTLSNFLSYDRTFATRHQVQGTLLYETAKFRTQWDSAGATNLPYPTQLWYNLGSGLNYKVRDTLAEYSLQSYMGRVNYTFNDKYTVNLTGRYDGSSVLAPGSKYQFFPAAALSWQVGDEPFMERLGALSDLKLRLSYGKVGNSAVGPYQTLGQLSQNFYTFGAQNPSVVGFQPGAIPNPSLKWETTDKYNLGFDYGFFNQRVSGTVDLYRENTKDLLLPRAIPYTTGYSTVLQNVGATRNKGVELSLTTQNVVSRSRGFEWSSDASFSANRNRIVSLAGGVAADVANSRFVGQPIQVNYDYKFIGIWQTADAALATSFNAKPGDIRVADLNGDGRITGDDRTFIGNHFNFPRWQGSLNNRFRFRDLDASVLATARVGYTVNSAFIAAYTNLAGRFNNMDVNYWTPENPSNEFPRPSINGIGNFGSALAYQNASHWRIRDITLGYAVPGALLRRAGTERARVYVRAQDPFLFTKFDGWDPEGGFTSGNGNSTSSQIEVGGPAFRSFLVGLDLGF